MEGNKLTLKQISCRSEISYRVFNFIISQVSLWIGLAGIIL